ncbi:hypothetical protein POM88_054863 [Heracleum sosnowskyi]|uniref:Uncharacterized protein n=1 Tax=Heracleum sosnowskyi TaxID=360622 RepID=A0AAD8GMD6_9APIA|nr:hypothetical protein POM88_054863 [Heracleum sosnowskyi]
MGGCRSINVRITIVIPWVVIFCCNGGCFIRLCPHTGCSTDFPTDCSPILLLLRILLKLISGHSFEGDNWFAGYGFVRDQLLEVPLREHELWTDHGFKGHQLPGAPLGKSRLWTDLVKFVYCVRVLQTIYVF